MCTQLEQVGNKTTYIIDEDEVIECSMKNILHHNTI